MSTATVILLTIQSIALLVAIAISTNLFITLFYQGLIAIGNSINNNSWKISITMPLSWSFVISWSVFLIPFLWL